MQYHSTCDFCLAVELPTLSSQNHLKFITYLAPFDYRKRQESGPQVPSGLQQKCHFCFLILRPFVFVQHTPHLQAFYVTRPSHLLDVYPEEPSRGVES